MFTYINENLNVKGLVVDSLWMIMVSSEGKIRIFGLNLNINRD
jgi:hypothetical protein